ncbi:MAG: hypothetical protein H6705_07085 [Myxococcales bacterium]|nr:hypothetical protein [Myxococcales bacterium]
MASLSVRGFAVEGDVGEVHERAVVEVGGEDRDRAAELADASDGLLPAGGHLDVFGLLGAIAVIGEADVMAFGAGGALVVEGLVEVEDDDELRAGHGLGVDAAFELAGLGAGERGGEGFVAVAGGVLAHEVAVVVLGLDGLQAGDAFGGHERAEVEVAHVLVDAVDVAVGPAGHGGVAVGGEGRGGGGADDLAAEEGGGGERGVLRRGAAAWGGCRRRRWRGRWRGEERGEGERAHGGLGVVVSGAG